MRPPVTATIGGKTLRLQLTGQTFLDASAEGVNLLGLLDGETVNPADVCTFVYWAARKHHPDITKADILDSVDFRDLRSLVPVAVSLLRDPDGDGDSAGEGKEGAAAGKSQ